MVALNQPRRCGNHLSCRSVGSSENFTTVLVFKMPVLFGLVVDTLAHGRQPKIPLRNEKLFIPLNAVIQGSHLLCTQQRSYSCKAQSLPGDEEIQSCSIPPSWVVPGPSGCTFPGLTQTEGWSAHFSKLPCQIPWRQGLQTNSSRGMSTLSPIAGSAPRLTQLMAGVAGKGLPSQNLHRDLISSFL